MTRQKNTHPTGGAADIEEVRPRLFRVRNPAANRFLKSEGQFKGTLFELTTWRRDGLLARLREQGFVVSSLEDQVQLLPALPTAVGVDGPDGEPMPHTVKRTDRTSRFDQHTLRWVPLEPFEQDGAWAVLVRAGWVVRFRKGRGDARYFQVGRTAQNHPHLSPLSETDALLMGYAQAAHQKLPPRTVQQAPSCVYLPDLLLPAPHATVMERLAEHTPQGWKVEKYLWPLARTVYETLGVVLVQRKARGKPRT